MVQTYKDVQLNTFKLRRRLSQLSKKWLFFAVWSSSSL